MKSDSDDRDIILVIDDTPANLGVIQEYLKDHDFKILIASSGESAIKRVDYIRPDIILLDVLMPGLDGYETCRILKADESIKDIPVIFMTALVEQKDKVKAFSVGAVDYITKPIQKEELIARINIHLKLHKYQEHLEREVKKRSAQLEERMVELENEIVERKQAEEELSYLRNYLFNIINSMPSVLIGVDVNGKVTQWNVAAEKTTGITAEDAHGKTLSDVFPQLASEMENISESIQTREVKQERKKLRQPMGDIRYEDIIIFPLITNGVDGVVIRIDDVSEKVRIEEILIQSEKMLSVGGLAAGMAHEINNPLAAVMQIADNISRRLDMDANIPANQKAAEAAGISLEAIHDYLEARDIPRMIKGINESGHRVIDVMNNMLRFSQKSDTDVSACSLENLLDKTLELASSDYDFKSNYDFKYIDIKKEYEDHVPLVPCESSKIQQVFLNILRNGSQVMQEAGTEQPQLIVRLRFEKKKQMVVIEIEDNGPGMDEATCKRVFEPFFTTKPKNKGTGLGLSVSYFIITDNHNGEMFVESMPGAGAKFTIGLPLK